MRTRQRLMKAYNNSIVRSIDRDSKYVFISDCHRGNGSFSDEFAKNRNTFIHALNYYYDRGFTYVEVGDGDELWEKNRMTVIQEAHTDAIAAMQRFHREERMIMMYGNHNIYLRDETYVKNHYYRYFNEYKEMYMDLFPRLKPIEALTLRHSVSGQELFVVHGHQGDLANDQLWPLTMLSLRYFWRYLHSFGIKSPVSPVRNIFKRHKIEKNYIKWINENRKLLICGHTHRFKFPRQDELPYFNTGCCVYPTTITAIELENDMLTLVRWKLLVNEDGLLKVQRMILQGPGAIADYDLRDTSETRLTELKAGSVHEIMKPGKPSDHAASVSGDNPG